MKYIKSVGELQHGKVYHTTYGAQYFVQFDKIEGSSMMALKALNTSYKTCIGKDGIFSNNPGGWFSGGTTWREATEEEIKLFNAADPIKKEEVLYDIY